MFLPPEIQKKKKKYLAFLIRNLKKLPDDEVINLKERYLKIRDKLKNVKNINELSKLYPELISFSKKMKIDPDLLLTFVRNAHEIRFKRIKTFLEYLIYLFQRKMKLVKEDVVEGIEKIEKEIKETGEISEDEIKGIFGGPQIMFTGKGLSRSVRAPSGMGYAVILLGKLADQYGIMDFAIKHEFEHAKIGKKFHEVTKDYDKLISEEVEEFIVDANNIKQYGENYVKDLNRFADLQFSEEWGLFSKKYFVLNKKELIFLARLKCLLNFKKIKNTNISQFYSSLDDIQKKLCNKIIASFNDYLNGKLDDKKLVEVIYNDLSI